MNAFKLTKCVCISALTLFIGIAAHAEEEHGLLATQVQLDASEISPNSAQTVIAAFMPTEATAKSASSTEGTLGSIWGTSRRTICIRRTVNGSEGSRRDPRHERLGIATRICYAGIGLSKRGEVLRATDSWLGD